MSPGADRRDFFVSFNSVDLPWAEWIAAELEAAGYTTFFQPWDFLPGSNFVLEMQKAATLADRTIAVLSLEFLKALFTQPEWAAALVQDPTGAKRKLIPVRVQPCSPDGILKAIVYTDLVGLDEASARAALLAAASGDRAKPKSVPFPTSSKSKKFPGKRQPAMDTSSSKPTEIPAAVPLPLKQPPPPKQPRLRKTPVDAALPFLWFALVLLLVLLMLWNAEKLAAFGLVDKVYYVALVAMALAAAGSLFRGLSSAEYKGDVLGGHLVLGGPAVVFFLVILLGRWFAPPPPPFPLTVFVHGPDGLQDLVLRSAGKVAIDFGPDRRFEAIGEKGEAHFPSVPAEFRGKEVSASLQAEGFERTDTAQLKLTGESVYLAVRKQAGRIYGRVSDVNGDPVSAVELDLDGSPIEINAKGRFDVAVPGDRVKPEMTLNVRAPGFTPQTLPVVPGSNEIGIQLIRRVAK